MYLPFRELSLELILASDLIEHFGRHEYMDVLREWRRVLQHNGMLHLKTPNLDSIIGVSLFFGGEETARRLYGNQINPYDLHKNIFTPNTLKHALLIAGFINVEVNAKMPRPDETNMEFVCQRR